MSRRKKLIIIAAIVVVILALVGGWFAFTHFWQTTESVSKHSVSASPTVGPIPRANIQMLEQALSSSDKATQGRALVPELRQLYSQQKTAALPVGSIVKIDATSVMASGNYAKAIAVVGVHRYVLHMVRQNGTWLIFDTDGVK